MSVATRTLKLNLLADVEKFGRGMDKASKSTKDFGNKTSKNIHKLSLAFKGLAVSAAYAFGKITKDSITAASDLNEEMSKTEVIFGNSADEIKRFAKVAATSLGMSKKSALQASGTFAVLGKSAGLTGPKLAGFSEQLVTMASDFASFYNTSTEDAITSIGSALRGESEPIRKYGVLLSAAALEGYAFNYEMRTGTTLARDSKNQLTDTSKVIARYQGIVEQSSIAQGDFNRTSSGLANQQRILAAQTENAKAAFGAGLLPVMLKIVKFANTSLIPAITGVINGFGGDKGLAKRVGEASDALSAARDAKYEDSWYNVGDALKQVANALAPKKGQKSVAASISDIANAMRSLADGINKVRSAWNSFTDTWKSSPSGVRSILGAINPVAKVINKVAGSRAQGGSVRAGHAYRVGEFGAETFVPQTNGRIVPSGSGGQNVTININGIVDAESARRSIERVIQQSQRRSGAINWVGSLPA